MKKKKRFAHQKVSETEKLVWRIVPSITL